MQIELKDMHKKLGITFIYVTHDQEEALTMSDTIVVMKSGEIQQVGKPMDIYNEPVNAFVANFIGESNIYNATMVGEKKVRFLNHVWDCVDDFPLNEKVDVVVRPEDVELTVIKDGKEPSKDAVVGKIDTKMFKGIHFEYVVLVGKSEVVVQSTLEKNVGDIVTLNVLPENIQIMKKELSNNIYGDAWIDKNNHVMISEAPFEADLTQLLSGSKIDEDGYLVSKDGQRYDLTDADVIAEVGLGDIELNDVEDSGPVAGKIVDMVYKGDHYQVLVRTDLEEDFVVDTLYNWNIDDTVWVSIPKNKIKLTLKGDIKKYVIEE